MGQAITTTQFYVYGRSHFTRTGWERSVKTYEQPNLLNEVDLAGRVYLVTGANSGIGFCLTEYLAGRNARVYMVCRNQERGEAARQAILKTFPAADARLVIADCGLGADVRRVVADLQSTESRLDGVVCNAGALLNEKQLTVEGYEVTFATHLLFGTYLLTSLAMPLLKATPGSRVVAVSSGGMYNTKFPSWDVATAVKGTYSGQMAYAYAKRGQVLLCEFWARQNKDVKFVSCHPGWTSTPGVTEAYGSQQKYLEPMRSLYEGTEGIMWLCTANADRLESGGFYLDRNPQRKHMSGPFMSEGNFTKNTDEEVTAMVDTLEDSSSKCSMK